MYERRQAEARIARDAAEADLRQLFYLDAQVAAGHTYEQHTVVFVLAGFRVLCFDPGLRCYAVRLMLLCFGHMILLRLYGRPETSHGVDYNPGVSICFTSTSHELLRCALRHTTQLCSALLIPLPLMLYHRHPWCYCVPPTL